MRGNVVFDFFFSKAATNEQEFNAGVVLEKECGVEKRTQWIGRAMITRIHDDEFAIEVMSGSEWVLIVGQGLEVRFVRPRWHDLHLGLHVGAGAKAIAHESIEGHDERRFFENDLVGQFEHTRDDIVRAKFPHRDELIGIEIHGPIRNGKPANPMRQHGCGANEGRGRAEEDTAKVRRRERNEYALKQKRRGAEDPSSDGLFAER